VAQLNIADLMNRQPLVLGAIGLGVGAAMAAALPSTAVETELLGQASADLQARARVIVGDVTERAAVLADGVTAAITTEAQAQGLTAESVKQGERRESKSPERCRPVHGATALRNLIFPRVAARRGGDALRASTARLRTYESSGCGLAGS
jgi:hypothetical protein